jgi:hypothetical protein
MIASKTTPIQPSSNLNYLNNSTMFKYILQGAGDINWMAILALVLFFVIFLFGSIYILSRKKDYVEKVSRLPLDD